ncbi:unnamed protein product [Pieris macdunnoughi]|uniref:Uncharacterized protein n=1 Tax=Pieris macdunnoughi TaxID=345717 RepID=A0A821WT86_9NEOP|nr:unnamed protein product [Pieris macdunnoughi]
MAPIGYGRTCERYKYSKNGLLKSAARIDSCVDRERAWPAGEGRRAAGVCALACSRVRRPSRFHAPDRLTRERDGRGASSGCVPMCVSVCSTSRIAAA